MWNRYAVWLVLGMMLVGSAVVLLGEMDNSVSLSAAMEVWGDVIRDVDQLGLNLTRISDQKEMEIGRNLAEIDLPESSNSMQWMPYVKSVGKCLVPHVRRKGIQYDFRVVNASWINSFALPGGTIVISTGMLKFLKSEAELAGILGHEISHVDQRHCIENLQTQIATKRIGIEEISRLVELPRQLLASGYKKYQELEADAAGLRLAVKAGYAPEGIVSPFERLREEFMETEPEPAKQPVSEIATSLEQSLGSYFDSHPPTYERISRLKQLISQQRSWLGNQELYIGIENYNRRIPKSETRFADSENR